MTSVMRQLVVACQTMIAVCWIRFTKQKPSTTQACFFSTIANARMGEMITMDHAFQSNPEEYVKINRVKSLEYSVDDPDSMLTKLPGSIIKQAVDDVKTFFQMELLSPQRLAKLHQLRRFAYWEKVRIAAESMAWILSDDMPFGTSLSFEECCNALHVCHENFRESVVRFVKQGPKAHLLYLRDHCEELMAR